MKSKRRSFYCTQKTNTNFEIIKTYFSEQGIDKNQELILEEMSTLYIAYLFNKDHTFVTDEFEKSVTNMFELFFKKQATMLNSFLLYVKEQIDDKL